MQREIRVPQDATDGPSKFYSRKIREEKQKLFAEGKLKKKDLQNQSFIKVMITHIMRIAQNNGQRYHLLPSVKSPLNTENRFKRIL